MLKPTLPADLHDFIDYYERTWIGTPGHPLLFSPWMWNHQDWHNGFASLVAIPNPTIWHFLDYLKLEQGLTEWKMVERSMKEPVQPRQKKWIDYDARLQSLVDGYEEEDTMKYHQKLIDCN